MAAVRKSSSDRPQVKIFQRVVPHYRVGVFETIASSTLYEYEVIYGKKEDELSLHLPDQSAMKFQASFRPHWSIRVLGRKLYFQWAEIQAAIDRKTDVLILLPDLHQPSYIIATLLGRLWGKKVIHWGHGVSRNGNLSNYIAIIRSRVNAMANAILLYGLREYRAYQERGISMDKYFVTKNALDTRKSTAIRSSITLAGLLEFKAVHGIADTRCLIFTGRFIKDKLLHGALEAVAILRKNIPNITLLLIGEGPAENDLKVLAKDLGIDQHVRFIGPVYDEEQLAYFYSASELAVSPGYVGLMVNHAFVFGVPVVTHDDYWRHAPEVAMIEPGKSGAFFKVNSWSAMAQTIQSLLEDKHQLEDMKRYCIELIAQEYNEKHMARVFDEAVTFVLNPDYSRSAPTQPTC